MERAFADGFVTETGTGITSILPPSNPFLPESGKKKQTVIEKLKAYLNKFLGVVEDKSTTYTQKDTESVSIIPMHTKYPDLDEESYGMAADKREDETEGDETT